MCVYANLSDAFALPPPFCPALPSSSASDVLPPEIANLLFLAESLNEVQTQSAHSAPSQQAHTQSSDHSLAADGFQTNTRGNSKKHTNTNARKTQSSNGMDPRKSSSTRFEHTNRFGSSGGGAAGGDWGSGEQSDGDDEANQSEDGGRDSQEEAGAERECWEEFECSSQGTEPVSLAELAGRICSAFPAEVTSLVDMSGGDQQIVGVRFMAWLDTQTASFTCLSQCCVRGPLPSHGQQCSMSCQSPVHPTGKKYLHQGVVALPFVALPLMANTLQLALGQGQALSVGEAVSVPNRLIHITHCNARVVGLDPHSWSMFGNCWGLKLRNRECNPVNLWRIDVHVMSPPNVRERVEVVTCLLKSAPSMRLVCIFRTRKEG